MHWLDNSINAKLAVLDDYWPGLHTAPDTPEQQIRVGRRANFVERVASFM
ncbi:hypothetical protein ACQI5H_20315 [Mycobacterium heidelbergense]